MNTIQAVTLFGQGSYNGTIVHAQAQSEYDVENPILVFPNGNVEYYETIVFAARKNGGKLAIILEKGGQNCHTVITMRERNGILVIHHPDARKLLKNGVSASINATTGTITID